MPEARLQRTREAYETGVAFRLRTIAEKQRAAARLEPIELPKSGHTDFGFEVIEPAPDQWRAPHDNAAEQLAREAARRSLDERFPSGYKFKNDDEIREACRLDAIATGRAV
jgi:2-hydroxychromene-2-carboxylate isomerase